MHTHIRDVCVKVNAVVRCRRRKQLKAESEKANQLVNVPLEISFPSLCSAVCRRCLTTCLLNSLLLGAARRGRDAA